ncbi:MAG: carbon-nitrogen hydrolase family protein [Lysobacterales bacterium]|nr:carbon-nitrogen hydrolase family protein [Xanthomonadales bacterium]
MSLPFAIAGVQMMVPALHSNLIEMLHRIDLVMIRFPWTQMIVFSELAQCGPVPNQPVTLPGPEETSLQAAAAKHGIWLIPGSVFERGSDGKLYNTTSVINPEGVVVDRYRKMFPFMPYEHDVTGGTDFCVFDIPGLGRCGLSICYDIWIPETTRTLTAMGAEVLIHPVLTGTIDRDVELAIARATAAQFQCYVFDINGLGAGGIGRSCIVDPTGTVLAQAGGSSETLPVEIDFARVRRQRETGVNGLGQPLKSFRDRSVDFSVYRRDSGTDAYLGTLGPLSMPVKGGDAGLKSALPEMLAPIPPRKLV